MEIRQLRYFVAVAEELHFGRAAKRLTMTQPPLSAQIKRLEAELGVELFHRTKRRVRLTPAGHELLIHARLTIDQAQRIEDVAARLRAGVAGHVRIGFGGSAAYEVLPSITRELARRAPDLILELRGLNTNKQISELRENRLDVGLLRPHERTPDLHLVTIRRHHLIAAVPADSRHGDSTEPLDLSDLADEPFIVFPRSIGPGLLDAVITSCANAGFSPRIDREVTRLQDLVSYVAGGLGVSLVPQPVERLLLDGVVYRRLVDPRWVELSLAWNPEGSGRSMPQVLDLVETVAMETARDQGNLPAT